MLLPATVFVIVALSFSSAFAAPVSGACGDQSKTPAAQRIKNTPKWTTASESDNFGYEVYRGESENGPFVKLTKNPILGAGTTDETHQYKFEDDTIDPCKDYWYYVESISAQGAREKFTPVFKAAAKRHPAEKSTGKKPAVAKSK